MSLTGNVQVLILYAFVSVRGYRKSIHSSQLAVRYTYDAWGKVTKDNVAGTTASGTAMTNNHLLYRGCYFDSETGLYYLYSRYYDPETGRFINADDVDNLGANGDFASLNLYTYCGNNPVSRMDDGGNLWIPPALIKAAVVALLYVGSSYAAAKLTGQDYTIWDGLIAAGTGALSTVNPVAAGLGGGALNSINSYYKNDHNYISALFDGAALALTTIYSPGNLGKMLDKTIYEFVSKTFVDTIFGFGANLTTTTSKLILDTFIEPPHPDIPYHQTPVSKPSSVPKYVPPLRRTMATAMTV